MPAEHWAPKKQLLFLVCSVFCLFFFFSKVFENKGETLL